MATHTFPTKGDAQAWLSAIETDINRRTWLDPAGAKVTVGEWIQHWLATVVDGRVGSDNTRSSYAQIVRVHVEPALGQIKLDKLTAEMVDRFVATKAKSANSQLNSQVRAVGAEGVEPPTSCASCMRSNQLSYAPDIAAPHPSTGTASCQEVPPSTLTRR